MYVYIVLFCVLFLAKLMKCVCARDMVLAFFCFSKKKSKISLIPFVPLLVSSSQSARKKKLQKLPITVFSGDLFQTYYYMPTLVSHYVVHVSKVQYFFQYQRMHRILSELLRLKTCSGPKQDDIFKGFFSAPKGSKSDCLQDKHFL